VESLRPRLTGVAAQASYDIAAATWEPKPGAARLDTGFTPASSLAGLEAALTALPAGRFERARQLTERCRGLLADEGYDVVTQANQGTLVSFRWPGDAAAAAAALYQRGVIVRDLPGSDLLRVSLGWWNDGSDLERLVEGLASIARA
jgi:L-cysteine/cystine lyase